MRLPLWIAAVMAAVMYPAFPASAEEPPHVSSHELTVGIEDGRNVVLGYRRENIEHLGGLPMTTRVAVVSDEVYAMVSRIGSTQLKEATLSIGYQVGCAVALGPLQLQMRSLAMAFGVNPDPSQGGRSKITVKPNKHGSLDTYTNLYPGFEISPGISETITIGSIADIPLAKGRVRNGQASAGVPPTRIEVDNCLGPAAIRSYAVLTMKSALADDTITTYGDPVTI